jgi:hypothetical protein
MKTWLRLRKLWSDIRKLMAGTHHIRKNPPKGAERKRRKDGNKS